MSRITVASVDAKIDGIVETMNQIASVLKSFDARINELEDLASRPVTQAPVTQAPAKQAAKTSQIAKPATKNTPKPSTIEGITKQQEEAWQNLTKTVFGGVSSKTGKKFDGIQNRNNRVYYWGSTKLYLSRLLPVMSDVSGSLSKGSEPFDVTGRFQGVTIHAWHNGTEMYLTITK